jgi:hypothetical protein
MRQLNNYIVEKLKLNKDIKTDDDFKKELSDFIVSFCKKRLNWGTNDYIWQFDEDKNKVQFYSSKFEKAVDINKVDRNMVIAFREAGIKCKDSRIFGNSIYFYF